MATLRSFFDTFTPNNTDMRDYYEAYWDKEYVFVQYKDKPEYTKIHWALDIFEDTIYIYEMPQMDWM